MYDATVLDLDTILATLSASSIVFYFLIPTFLLLITVLGVRVFLKKRKIRKMNKSVRIQHLKEVNDKRLANIDEEPLDKSRFRSLSLSFDEKGRAIS